MIKKIALALIASSILCAQANAKPANKTTPGHDELANALYQGALFHSQHLDTQRSQWVKSLSLKNPWFLRLQVRQAMLDNIRNGLPEGKLPGAITSWIQSFPFDCPSLSDFERPLSPESNGFDTSQPLQDAKFSHLA